jgi:hypothetical protein
MAKRKKTETKAPKRGPGRPSDYTIEFAERFCDQVAEGVSVRQICSQSGMPDRRTIYKWLARHEEFRRLHDAARLVQADLYFEQCLEIADNADQDFITTSENGATIKKVDHEAINRARLKVDTRKWVCARLSPRKYGDRVTNEMTGEVGINVMNDLLREIDGMSRGLPAREAPEGECALPQSAETLLN